MRIGVLPHITKGTNNFNKTVQFVWCFLISHLITEIPIDFFSGFCFFPLLFQKLQIFNVYALIYAYKILWNPAGCTFTYSSFFLFITMYPNENLFRYHGRTNCISQSLPSDGIRKRVNTYSFQFDSCMKLILHFFAIKFWWFYRIF